MADINIAKELIRKPMLAPNQQVAFDDPKITYPMLASQKYDGFRALVIPSDSTSSEAWRKSHLVSRNYKVFANDFKMRNMLSKAMEYARERNVVLDCEFFNPKLTFSELGSIVRKEGRDIPEGTKLYVFDIIPIEHWVSDSDLTYFQRMKLMDQLKNSKVPYLEVVEQVECNTPEDAENVFNLYRDMGEEGIMLRSYDGKYKHGRATINQGLIYKFKVKATADAVILGFKNGTDAKEGIEREVDALGHRKHLGKVGDRVEADRLGSIIVRMEDGTETNIGLAKTFLDEEYPDADAIWENREIIKGMCVEFEYMPVGVKDKPRWGRLTRFRRDKTFHGELASGEKIKITKGKDEPYEAKFEVLRPDTLKDIKEGWKVMPFKDLIEKCRGL